MSHTVTIACTDEEYETWSTLAEARDVDVTEWASETLTGFGIDQMLALIAHASQNMRPPELRQRGESLVEWKNRLDGNVARRDKETNNEWAHRRNMYRSQKC